jgi:hypothetical protein
MKKDIERAINLLNGATLDLHDFQYRSARGLIDMAAAKIAHARVALTEAIIKQDSEPIKRPPTPTPNPTSR